MNERETFDALHSFASIARELAGQPGLGPTTQRIVDLAVKVVGCDAAVLVRRSGTKLVYEAGTDGPLTQVVETIANSTGQSVTLQACEQRATVLSNDLEKDSRWPMAVPRTLRETPVRAVLAFHLQLEDRDLGALTFYSETPNYFTPPLCDLGGVYADHAAVALSSAREHAQVENLTIALSTSREIGTAIGIVMNQFSLDDAKAFDLLRVASQHANRKLHDIAHDIVTSGDIRPLAAASRTPAAG